MGGRAVVTVIAVLGAACNGPPGSLTVGDPPPAPGEPPPIPRACAQSPLVEPLGDALLRFLPPISRPGAIAAADALIADNSVALARRPPFVLPDDPDWREDPFGDPTWVYEYQSLLFVLDPLLAYDDTGEERYLDVAELQVRRWLDDYLREGFRGSWGDHIMANRTRILLKLWEASRLRDPESAVVVDVCRALELHAAHLLLPAEYSPNSNHGHFQDEALLSLAIAFADHPDRDMWSRVARDRVSDQIDYAVSGEGVHREHSPSYHAGMQLRFAGLARLLANYNLTLRIDIDAVIESMWGYSAYGVMPDGKAPLIGDSTSWFGSASSSGITGEAAYSFSKGTLGEAPAEVDRVFPLSGYAFFRDRWHPTETFADTVYVAFVAAYFSTVHKHCDDLSVLLYGYGHRWLTDSGFWSYDPDDFYTVLSNAPAGHNVVEVDGLSYYNHLPVQDPERAPAEIVDFEVGAARSSVTGLHRFNYGVRYTRTLTYERPARLVVRDELLGKDLRVHSYVIRWHIAPDKQVEQLGPGRFRASSDDNVVMELEVSSSDPVDCEIIIADDDPYQGWYFPSFLEAVPAPVIACSLRAVDADFTTEVELVAPDPLERRVPPQSHLRNL